MADDSRALILARRARFLAAALAGVSVGVTPALARAEEGDGEPAEPGPPPAPVGPQICLSDDSVAPEDDGASADAPPRICLSDIDIEGEVAPPPPTVRPSPPPPRVCLSVVPDSADRPYLHDGLLLRPSVGIGVLVVDVESDAGDRSSGGVAWVLGAELGMTVARGTVLGLDLALMQAPAPGDRFTALGLFRLGPCFDLYPDSTAGLHLGVAPGPLVIRAEQEHTSASAVGWGGAVWLGYDTWLSADWSLGLRLSGHGAWLGRARDEAQSRLAARALALELGLAYH